MSHKAPPPGAALGNPAAFIRAQTKLAAPPLVPEIQLHLASEVVPLWQLTEEELQSAGLPPPFWAFAWAGGQALARYILDHPEIVAGKRMLDFGAGSGLVGLAALKAGAASVLAADIDPVAAAACAVNAEANTLPLEVTPDDLTGAPASGVDVILAGDICYEEAPSRKIIAWLAEAAGRGLTVLIGDPGRTFLPRERLEELAVFSVPTTRELEDSDLRRTAVWRFKS